MGTSVGQSVKKYEGRELILGRPVYTEDLCPKKHLWVRVCRSPYAFAKIKGFDLEEAKKVSGIVGIYTYKDVPKVLHSIAVEAYPEGSPYDRYMLDDTVRYVGDPVAIVTGWDEDAVKEAVSKVKVDYEVLTPVLDFTKAIDNPIRIHEKEDTFTNFDVGAQPERNIATSIYRQRGDVDKVMESCEVVKEGTYLVPSQPHAMLETHRCFTYIDDHDRLVLTGCIHSPFNMQRIISKVLQIPQRKIRVISVKSGGSFGGKNSIFVEHFCAFVTWKTGYAAMMILDREECFEASTVRHGMKVWVKVGADHTGKIRTIDMHCITNAGAYAEHSYDVLCVSCSNTLPIYGGIEAIRYRGEAAYSNTISAGAFRGFGSPQATFALAGTIAELAKEIGKDVTEVHLKNILKQGEKHPFLSGGGGNPETDAVLYSTALKECIEKGKKMIGWDEIYPFKRINRHKVRSVGVGIAQHGSGIAKLDNVAVDIRFNHDGSYTLFSGVADFGTGGQTAIMQIAAEVLMTTLDRFIFVGADTDTTPYDKGPYASSTVYITGNAAKKAAEKMKSKLIEGAAEMLQVPAAEIVFDGETFSCQQAEKKMTLDEFAMKMVSYNGCHQITVTASNGQPVAPPPYVAGFAEIELDEWTGKIKILKFAAVCDCGTVINPAFARVQLEGGIAQGIGYAMYENVVYDENGKMLSNNYHNYKIPCICDVPEIETAFEQSYEPTGPFGAKSIGEVVFHTPVPAIANAIYNAEGINLHQIPFTPERIYKAIRGEK